MQDVRPLVITCHVMYGTTTSHVISWCNQAPCWLIRMGQTSIQLRTIDLSSALFSLKSEKKSDKREARQLMYYISHKKKVNAFFGLPQKDVWHLLLVESLCLKFIYTWFIITPPSKINAKWIHFRSISFLGTLAIELDPHLLDGYTL